MPFANLVKPYEGMRELWNASTGRWPYDQGTPLLGTWWALYLLNALAGQGGRFAEQSQGFAMGLLYAMAAVNIGLAIAAILLVQGIARGQEMLGDGDLGEIFA